MPITIIVIMCIIAIILKETTPIDDHYLVGFVLGSMSQIILQIVK